MVNSSRVREENPLLGDTGGIGILQFKNSPKASMNGRDLRWLFCGMTTKSDVASFESKHTQSGHQTALQSQKKSGRLRRRVGGHRDEDVLADADHHLPHEPLGVDGGDDAEGGREEEKAKRHANIKTFRRYASTRIRHPSNPIKRSIIH